MTYDLAAELAYVAATVPVLGDDLRDFIYGQDTPTPPDSSGIYEIAVDGEILSLALPLGQADQNLSLDSGVAPDLTWFNPISRHSQALLVVRLYADDEWANKPEWTEAARYVFPALLSDEVAESAGFEEHGPDNSAGYVMSNTIAYTAHAGEADSALKAFYDDTGGPA